MEKKNNFDLYCIFTLYVITTVLCMYLINSNIELKQEILEIKAYMPENNNSMFTKENVEDAYGRYFLSSGNIALYNRDLHPYKVKMNAEHEIGHYIWYTYINKDAKKEYCNIYNNASIFVSDYAETNCEEDFAETLSHSAIYDIDYTNVPLDRQNFIKKYVENYIIT